MSYDTIRLAVDDPIQRDAVLEMRSGSLSALAEGVAEARMRWFHGENPVGASRTILAVHRETSELVGCGSAFSRRMWVAGQAVKAAVPCDFAVVKKHRVGGAALAIQRAFTAESHADGHSFLFGCPNHMSLPIVKRVGYHVVGDAHAWVKPLHAGYKLEKWLHRWRLARLARLAGLVADVGLRVIDRAKRPPSDHAWSSELLDRADGRFDLLWERGRQHYQIVGEQSSAFLNWRYAGSKTMRYRFFALIDHSSMALAGFVVFHEGDGKVFVADLFAIDRGAAMDRLLLAFAARMRDEDLDSIYLSYVGPRAFGQRLERLGFWKSADQQRSLVVYTDKHAPAEFVNRLREPANWLLFDGEMDI